MIPPCDYSTLTQETFLGTSLCPALEDPTEEELESEELTLQPKTSSNCCVTLNKSLSLSGPHLKSHM